MNLPAFDWNAITHEPSTWPAGDSLWSIARAIAYAEGASIAGSVPDGLNNPGCISDGSDVMSWELHNGQRVTVFESKKDGWLWLRNKLYIIASAQSATYSRDMTWEQFSIKWARDYKPWVATVAHILNVAPTTTLAGYLRGEFSNAKTKSK